MKIVFILLLVVSAIVYIFYDKNFNRKLFFPALGITVLTILFGSEDIMFYGINVYCIFLLIFFFLFLKERHSLLSKVVFLLFVLSQVLDNQISIQEWRDPYWLQGFFVFMHLMFIAYILLNLNKYKSDYATIFLITGIAVINDLNSGPINSLIN